MAIAPVLKTGVRKDFWVRIPGPPFHRRGLSAQWPLTLLPVIAAVIAVHSAGAQTPEYRIRDALKVADSLMQTNPLDAHTLNIAWRVYLAGNEFEKALSVGEQMIQTDTSMADTAFFIRSAAAATTLDPRRGARIAARGLAKFPENMTLRIMHAKALEEMREGGESLNRNVPVDSVDEMYRQKLLIMSAMGLPDSVLATIRRGAAEGANRRMLALMALKVGSDTYKTGNVSKRREQLQLALELLLLSNELNPSKDARFLAGASAFLIGKSATTEADQKKDCNLARLARNSFVAAQENVPAGLEAYRSAASSLLDSTAQFSETAEKQIQRFCH